VGSRANLSARRGASLILAIAAVFALQASLCSALCSARSVEPAPSQLDDASAPENAHCHHASNAPSRDETRPDGNADCCLFDRPVLAPPSVPTVFDAPETVLVVAFFRLPPVHPARVDDLELALAPPPRDLLLVKNSFLI